MGGGGGLLSEFYGMIKTNRLSTTKNMDQILRLHRGFFIRKRSEAL